MKKMALVQTSLNYNFRKGRRVIVIGEMTSVEVLLKKKKPLPKWKGLDSRNEWLDLERSASLDNHHCNAACEEQCDKAD